MEPTDEKITMDIPSKLNPKEQNRLQAMMGNGKQQAAKYYLNEKGKKEVLDDSTIIPQATVFFKNCEDCEFVLDAMCTKVLIEGCHNTKIILKQKVVTSTVDVYKCDNFHLQVHTKVGTLQTDVCTNLTLQFEHKEYFQSLIWAGLHNLTLNFEKENRVLKTGLSEMQTLYGELSPTIDQFIVRWIEEDLKIERLIRLDNGFPTTEREKKTYDSRQEETLQKLAQEAGITIGKKGEKKIPPNSVCPKCKSGLKYKKCCGKSA